MMPELPEVEMMKQGLNDLVAGRLIESVEVNWDAIIEEPDVETFKSQLMGQKIKKIERRGKYLIFKLSDYDLISHLRMTGRYMLAEEEEVEDEYSHIIFHLNEGKKLIYHDIRKFGRMALVDEGLSVVYSGIRKLGPEPFFDDINISEFSEALQERTSAIKSVLLDQSFIAGLGNIYADESLYRAAIHPEMPANQLTRDETVRLYLGIIEIIRLAIKEGGSTIRNYKNAFGQEGQFQNYFKVYGREGEACDHCGSLIQKIKVADRGTHFCPQCQVKREQS